VLELRGDFYEATGVDAESVAKVLGLVVVSRDMIPLTAIPRHAFNASVDTLRAASISVRVLEPAHG
jgi:DNA mismatch repair ATPase MutS